jgi:hypothetical protein
MNGLSTYRVYLPGILPLYEVGRGLGGGDTGNE